MPLVQAAVQGTVTTAVFRRQGEIDQCPDRPVRAEQSVGKFEQRVSPSVQAAVEVATEE
jgi:hypothetical protein